MYIVVPHGTRQAHLDGMAGDDDRDVVDIAKSDLEGLQGCGSAEVESEEGIEEGGVGYCQHYRWLWRGAVVVAALVCSERGRKGTLATSCISVVYRDRRLSFWVFKTSF